MCAEHSCSPNEKAKESMKHQHHQEANCNQADTITGWTNAFKSHELIRLSGSANKIDQFQLQQI